MEEIERGIGKNDREVTSGKVQISLLNLYLKKAISLDEYELLMRVSSTNPEKITTEEKGSTRDLLIRVLQQNESQPYHVILEFINERIPKPEPQPEPDPDREVPTIRDPQRQAVRAVLDQEGAIA